MIRSTLPVLPVFLVGHLVAAEPVPQPSVPVVAPAEEAGDRLTIGGYIDTVWSSAISRPERDSRSSLADGQLSTFDASAKVKLGWAITSRVHADLRILVQNEETEAVTLDTATVGWSLTDAFTLMVGKWSNNIGWQGAEPADLWRVNYGPTSDYAGGSWVGMNGHYLVNDRVSVDVTIFNGWDQPFTSQHRDQATTGSQRPQDLGYGLDLTWTKDETSVNAECYFAPNSAPVGSSMPGRQPGNLLQPGINFTAKVSDISLGGELIWRHLTPQTIGGDASVSQQRDARQDDVAWMLAAKRDVSYGAWSVMVSQIYRDVNNRPSDDERDVVDGADVDGGGAPLTGAGSPAFTSELALALSTTPVGSPSFAVNYEVAYAWASSRQVITTWSRAHDDALTISIEVLAVVP